MNRRLARNIASNYVLLGVQAAYIGLLTPLIIGQLGARVFGGWVLILAIVGYLRLLELGMGPTTARFVAAARDLEDLNRIVSTSGMLLSALGATAIVTGFFVAVFAHPNGVPGFAEAMIIVTVSRAIQLPLTVTGHVFYGLERLVERNAFQATRTFAALIAIILVLLAGGGLIAIAVAGALAELTITAAQAAYCLRVVPGLAPSVRHIDGATTRKLTSFSAGVFILGMSTQVIVYSDTIVVASVLGAGAVAVYAVAMRVVEAANMLLSQVSDAFLPVFARLDAGASTLRSRSMVLAGTRFTAAVAFCIVGLLIAFGQPLLELWVGHGFSVAYVPLLLLSAGVAFNAPLRFAVLWTVAAGRHRVVAMVAAAEAVANLGLTLVLVGPLGLRGVALASCLTFAVSNGLIIPWLIARQLGVSYGRAFAEPYVRAALVTIPAAVLLEQTFTPRIADSGPSVLLASGAWLAMSLTAASFAVLKAEERRRVANFARSLKPRRPARLA